MVFVFLYYFCLSIQSLAASGDDRKTFWQRQDRNFDLHLRHEAGILKVVRQNREATLQRKDGKSRALQADLEEIHLLSGKMSIGVDISEAPLQSEGDEIGLGRQRRREAEAILLENSHLPRRANLGGSVVKGTRGALSAEHGLAEAGVRGAVREASAVVRVLSSVEGADGTVEEGARRVGARVVSAAVGNARLWEGVLKEGDNLGRHDVGDEVGVLLGVARRHGRHGGAYLVVPGVVRDHEAVDEVGEDRLLVGSGRVGLPDGGDLLHGVVEEGGVSLGQAELNCGHFSRF